jgi:hypothetical protein
VVGFIQQGHDPLEVRERQALGLGDGLQRDGRLVGLAAEFDEQAHAVLRLRREDHAPRLMGQSYQ